MRSCPASRNDAGRTASLAYFKFVIAIVLFLNSVEGLNFSRLSTASRSAPSLNVQDFIIVINTDQERLRLATAWRALRSGIRTYIALDNSTLVDILNQDGDKYNETYAYFPNRNATGPEADKPGDTRWQAAPFMAHHHYGDTYKWILLADDDTLWFMMGVQRLLHGYDPNLPYAISDHLGDHNLRGFFVPSPLAAVCSPCHWPDMLRDHGMEHLLSRSSTAVSEVEQQQWNPKELDGWGIGTPLMNRVMRYGRHRQKGGAGAGSAHADELGGSVSGQATDGSGADAGDSEEEAEPGRSGRNAGQQRRLGGALPSRPEVLGGVDEWPNPDEDDLDGSSGGGGEGLRRLAGTGSAKKSAHRLLLLLRRLQQQQQQQLDAKTQFSQLPKPPLVQQQQLQQQLLQHQAGGLRVWALQQRQRLKLSHGNMSALLAVAFFGGPDAAGDGSGAQVSSVAASSSAAGSGASAGGSNPSSASDNSRVPGAIPWPVPPAGCPCQPPVGCLHRARLCRGQSHVHALCSRPLVFKVDFRGNRTWCRHSWAHGGAGVVLSVGLMRAVAGGPAEVCARTTNVHSCDMNLAMCLMKADAKAGAGAQAGGAAGAGDAAGSVGFMFTHPGHAALAGAHWADPRFMLFDNPVYQEVLLDPEGFLEGRLRCAARAREEVLAAIATHALGAGKQVTLEEGGEASAVVQPAAAQEKAPRRRSRAGASGAIMEALMWAAKRDREGGASALTSSGRRGPGGGDGLGRAGSGPGVGMGRVQRKKRQLAAQEGVGDGARVLQRGVRSESGAGTGAAAGVDTDNEDRQACEWLVEHAVSLHLHRRRYASTDAAAEVVRGVIEKHLKAQEILRSRAQART